MKRNSSRRHYLQQLAAQQKPRAIARTQSQNREASQRRMRLFAAAIGTTLAWFLWQVSFFS